MWAIDGEEKHTVKLQQVIVGWLGGQLLGVCDCGVEGRHLVGDLYWVISEVKSVRLQI